LGIGDPTDAANSKFAANPTGTTRASPRAGTAPTPAAADKSSPPNRTKCIRYATPGVFCVTLIRTPSVIHAENAIVTTGEPVPSNRTATLV